MTSSPSRTALMAAAARAAHLIVDRPPYVFADPLAEALLGERADELLAYHRHHGSHPVLAGARAQVVCRSRVAEDVLRDSGHGQYVLLGAGLDSFAYRCPGLSVFEVDLAATQRHKREALRAAGIPEAAAYLSDVDALEAHGFDLQRPAVVAWLGVSMYLTAAAIERTVAAVGRLAPGSVLVFDHMVPAGQRDAEGQAYVDAVGPVNAEHGEPWLTFLSASEAAGLLGAHGLDAVHVRQSEVLAGRTDALRPSNLACVTVGIVRPR